jgi:hypothetical protein
MRCLALRPEYRPASAAALARELAASIDEPVTVPLPAATGLGATEVLPTTAATTPLRRVHSVWGGRLHKASRRRLLAAVLGAASLLVLAVILAVALADSGASHQTTKAATHPAHRTPANTTPAAPTTAVTAAPTTTTPPTTTTSPAQQGAAELIQRAEALMQAGDYQDALPLLQQATRQLQGVATPDEARADTDLAATIVQLGSCDGVIPLLDRAEQLQGPQPETDRLRTACSGPPGHRPGHGHGHGNGNDNEG